MKSDLFSTVTLDAVRGAPSDSIPVQWSDIPQNPHHQMEPHLGSNPFTLNRCSMMMCSQTQPIPNYAHAYSLRPIAARCYPKYNNLSPNSDARRHYSHQNRPGDCAELPHRNVSSPDSRMLDGQLTCAVTAVTTRPDSLLSSSSLTADSSLSDSTPNSCSSRDSALGSTIQQNVSERHTQNNLNTLSALESSGIKPLREPTENCRSTPNQYHHINAVPRVTSRTYPTPTQPSIPCELKLPPTPRRQYWSPPAPEDGTSMHRLSQRLRMERKHSVYVNSAICPLPEHSSDHSRTSTTRMSPPASWTQLLPYRVSTVPQNLSERLKKSETLPNDVWIHAQQSSNVPEVRTLTGSQSHAEDLGMISTNGPRSPPPRPPMRTTSQKLIQANHPGLRANAEQSSRGSILGNHNPAWLSGGQTRAEKVEHIQNTRTDSSPVLCRYSQLYSLPFNPKLVNQISHATVHPQPTVTCTTTACLGGSGEATSDMYDMRMERLDLAS
ncbi:hypothetical protein AHF37_11085 [Paragonimus kellicotti]|nr:hypothetical protein AHF37_11085 [Paragonimus kellicotti]